MLVFAGSALTALSAYAASPDPGSHAVPALDAPETEGMTTEDIDLAVPQTLDPMTAASVARSSRIITELAATKYTGRVASQGPLLVREGPSQDHESIGSLPHGQTVDITCKVNGPFVEVNPRWYKLDTSENSWVSARYIANTSKAPVWC